MQGISPLLALRLRRLSGAGQAAAGALRLFCFPHAGGGAAAFHGWAERLPRGVVVVPMRPPRPNKPDNMADLVSLLSDAMQPYLDEPFAFFGHSMGAIVAFELARLLRRVMPGVYSFHVLLILILANLLLIVAGPGHRCLGDASGDDCLDGARLSRSGGISIVKTFSR